MIRITDILKLAAFIMALASPAHAQDACGGGFGLTRPFFYAITRDQKTSHLLGTIPAGLSLQDMPTEVHQVLDRATNLTMEFRHQKSLLDWVDTRVMSLLMMNRSGPRLSNLLTRVQWDVYLRRLMQLGFPAQIADRVTVGTAALLMSPLLKNIRDRETRGRLNRELDLRFRGKTVRVFHPPFYRIRTLGKYEDVDYLRAQLGRDPDKVLAAFEKAYRAGDEAAILALFEEERRLSPRIAEMTVLSNTRSWAPMIAERHRAKGQHVFAVSVVHLPGPDGLLENLRRQGFTIERVDGTETAQTDVGSKSSVVFETGYK